MPHIENIAALPWRGNTLLAWVSACLTAIVVFSALQFVKHKVLVKLEKPAERFRDGGGKRLIETLRRTNELVLVIAAFYAGAQFLTLPSAAEKLLWQVFIVFLLMQAGLWVSHYLGVWSTDYRERQVKKNPAAATTMGALRVMLQMTVWIFIFLLILDNFGFNVRTLLTGLGIGGIAVALAVQNILGNLLASLSIVMDKTFVIGDFLTVGDLSGTVEYIGLRNTRIRSLSGEQIIFSNTDLLGSRIRNYGRMFERRAQLKFSVAYQNDRAKLEKISDLVRDIVQAQEKTRFDYAHITSFGPGGIEVEYAYYVLSADYDFYLRAKENVNLHLLDSFKKEGIGFAYPT